MPVAAISDEDFKDWRVCNRINSAFSTPFDNELVTTCIKCGTEIPAGTLPYRSLFISHAVESSCSHLRTGSLCNDCDMDMVFRVTRGEETCFDQGCDAVLTVDKSMISTALARFPGKLLADYLAILGNECIICAEIVSRTTRRATAKCIHEANVCELCLKQMIDTLVESNQWNSLLCPQSGCRAQLKLEDILAFGSPASYETYEQQQLQRTLKDIPGYLECKRGAGLCSSGQIHVPADSQPKMICTKCNFASCFTCKIPWHENQTCAQYQFLLNDGESEEYKRKYCKRCPRSGCGAPTKKYKACHEMVCANVRECRTSWCWDCKVILDNSVGYVERAMSQHLSSCTAPVVMAKKSQAGYKSIPMPSASDGRYRNGWNEDRGFVGTGDEY